MTGVSFAIPLLFLFAAPYWEAKAPAQWSEIEIAALLNDSPWAHQAVGPKNPPPVRVFFATARPIAQALEELERRATLKNAARNPPKPADDSAELDTAVEDYREWLRDNRDTHFILAVQMPNPRGFADATEVKRMEDGVIMQAGRRKIKMTGHFPPSPADPYLRLAFPREVDLKDKTLIFELYLPGVNIPFRTVEFDLKQMVVQGKLEL